MLAERYRTASPKLNIATNFLTKGVVAGLNLVAIPPLLKALGSGDYALFTLLNIVITYLALFDLGLSRGLIKPLVEALTRRDLARFNRELNSALWLMVAVSTAVALLTALGSRFITTITFGNASNQLSLIIIGVTMIPMMVKSVFSGVLTAAHDFVRINIGIIIFEAGKWLGFIALVSIHQGSIAHLLLWQMSCAFVLLVMYSVFCLRIEGITFSPRLFEMSAARELFGSSWKIASTDMLARLSGQVDKFVVAGIIPLAGLGFYFVAFQLSSKVWDLQNNIVSVFYPTFSKLHAEGRQAELKALFLDTNRTVLLVILPAVLMLSLFGHELATVWLSPASAGHLAPILAWLGPGILFVSLIFSLVSVANALGYTTLPLIAQVFFVLTNLALMVVLGRTVGVNGLPMAWTAAAITQFLVLITLILQKLGLTTQEYFVGTIDLKVLPLLVFTLGSFLGLRLLKSPVWYTLGTAGSLFCVIEVLAYRKHLGPLISRAKVL